MIYYNPKPTNWFGPYHAVDLCRDVMKKVPILKQVEKNISDDAWDSIAEKLPLKPFQQVDSFIRSIPFVSKKYVKIHPWDTWSMDHTLCHIVIPMLKQLKETKHGIPSEFVHEDYYNSYTQLSLDFGDKEELKKLNDDYFNNVSIKKWDDIIDAMIWSFEELNKKEYGDAFFEPYWEDMTEEEIAEEKKKKIEGYTLFKKSKGDNKEVALSQEEIDDLFFITKKINKEKYDEYYSKFSYGFEMFGKYYTNLWD